MLYKNNTFLDSLFVLFFLKAAADVLIMIDAAKRPLLRNNRHSREYRVLKIVEHIIETVEGWTLTGAETIVY